MPPRKRKLPPEIYRRRRAAGLMVAAVALAAVVGGVVTAVVLVGSAGGSGEDTAAQPSSRPLPTMIRGGVGDPLDEDYFQPFTPPGWVQESQDGGARAYAQGPCADDAVSVEVTMDRRNFLVGDHPRFVMVVTNHGDKACARDFGSAQQQILVRAVDGPQVWRNLDCASGTGRDAWTLTPGQRVAFATVWSGATSAPGCQGRRDPVAPGLYEVVAQLGPIASAPMQFAVNAEPPPPPPPPPPALPPPPAN